MRKTRFGFVVAATALLFTCIARADALKSSTTQAAEQAKFMRFQGDSKTGGTLETADVTYQNDAGVKVRLVAAVHIADTNYFQQLNDSFKKCDAVLY
ncbi:MAG TPA: hypothetical protein VF669_15325 [Tepidisphaeraceae bacterium]|jgi:hypothetical protein